MKKQMLTIIVTILLAIVYIGCNGSNESRLRDSRDGKIYKTVKIGEQWWMAENLNYAMEDSYCYQDDPVNCLKYGRLYTWDAAQKACPAGWHVPSKVEFETLLETVDSENNADKELKSTSGWNESVSDAFGFSALPAGNMTCDNSGECTYEENMTIFWTSRKYLSCCSVVPIFSRSDAICPPTMVYSSDEFCLGSHSVRCLKD